MNELTGTITLFSGAQARVVDKSLMDSLEGTVLWEYNPISFPQMIVQLYKGLMKVYMNHTIIFEGSTAMVEHKDKDQGWEIAESFIVCGYQAYKMHIRSIANFVHNDDSVEVSKGSFLTREAS